METVEFKKRANGLPIIALHGNEIFYIGMPLQELNDILWNHYAVHGEQQNDGIGIGSLVRELCDQRNDVFFDEQYIMVGQYPYDCILEIDNNGNTIYNLSDVYENKITKIIVENRNILRS